MKAPCAFVKELKKQIQFKALLYLMKNVNLRTDFTTLLDFQNELRTVPTNSKVLIFFASVYDYAGNVHLNKCY